MKVLVKFNFPVAGVREYATEDEAAAIKMAQEEFHDKKDLDVSIFKEEEPDPNLPRTSDVRSTERGNDPVAGDVSEGSDTPSDASAVASA